MSGNVHRRKSSIRLEGYEYSQAGVYFVTICVRGKKSELSEIRDSQVFLTQIGKLVDSCLMRVGYLKARITMMSM